MRTDLRHLALKANLHADAILNEDMTLIYKGRRIPWVAKFKKDQVETADSAGNIALVDREYVLVQDRFVMKKLSERATIERQDIFAPSREQTKHYSILGHSPRGDGWTMVLLKRERTIMQRTPTRHERYPTPVDSDTSPPSLPRSAR